MRDPAAIAALVAGAFVGLAGCQALDTKYERATLEEVLTGRVVSGTSRFRISRPPIPVARRNTGIVRDGSVFVVIVAPGLKNVVATHTGDDTEYGVRLMRKPHAFLIVEKVWSGGQEIDLFEGVDRVRFDFPDLVPSSEMDLDGFPGWSAGTPLAAAAALRLDGFRIDRRDMAPGFRDLLVPGLRGTGDRRCFLRSGNVEVLVRPPDPMTRLMLDFLISEGKSFDGGVRVVQELDPGRSGGIHAVVEVHWIRLAGGLYFRAPVGDDAAPVA